MMTMEDRLRERIPIIEQIRAITGQPSMSIGVIHQGQEVFKHNTGVLDVETGQEPDSDSLYCIASLSKAFMSAAIDLLVQEDKLTWDATVNSIIPDFKHAQQPDVFSTTTIRDICSHRTGLLSLDEVTQGLDGRILIPKKDVIKVCNALPIKHNLRSNFLYNNALYELAGCIVEHVSSHHNWGDFQHDRIFKPLGMSRTTAFRDVHKKDSNIATPYMVLTNGATSKIAPTELAADSMNGGSGGIRSSVNDLLKWAHCLLRSFSNDPDASKHNLVRDGSPLWNRQTIANHHSAEDGDYCTGWCYHRTPAKLGLISPNRCLESPVIGAGSPSLLVYGHQGDVPGYTCNLYIIPESQSALVLLSNGTGLSDGTDWVAQDLIQTIHELQPRVDFVEAATRARTKYLSLYTKEFKIPLEEHQRLGTQPPPLSDVIGTYIMECLDVAFVEVFEDPARPGKLQMMVNKQKDQVYNLWHYHYDVFCQLPDSYDECISRGLYRTHWTAFLISFERDEGGKAGSFCWKMDGVDVHFNRV